MPVGKGSKMPVPRQRENSLLIQKGRSDLLKMGGRDLAGLNIRVRIEPLLRQGAHLYREEEFGRAFEIFSRVLRIDFWNTSGLEGCGFCAHHMGLFAQAQRFLRVLPNHLSGDGFRTSQGVEMVNLPGGSFRMGTDEEELALAWEAELINKSRENGWSLEETRRKPEGSQEVVRRRYARHRVRLSPFCFAETCISNGQFRDFRTRYRARIRDLRFDSSPACMSWEEAVAFCQWLSKRDGRLYRLPTEAEWEYVARIEGKGETAYSGRFGDLRSNVFQWCLDYYADDYYPRSPKLDPFGPDEGTSRVVRGGTASCRKDNVCTYPWGRQKSDLSVNELIDGDEFLCRHVTGLRLVCACDRKPGFLEYGTG